MAPTKPRKSSTSQIAERLGITRQHASRLCREGKLIAERPTGERGWWKVTVPEKTTP